MSVYRIHKGGAWNSLSKSEQKRLNDLLLFKIFLMFSTRNKIIFLFLKLKKKGKSTIFRNSLFRAMSTKRKILSKKIRRK